MGVVDRTDEFRLIVRDIAAKNGGLAPSLDGQVPQAQSELNMWSAAIGSEIHQASLKVQELRKMARAKGIFNDKSSEIQNLTLDVKGDITKLNQKIEALEAKSKIGGTNRSHQTHSNNVVDTLKTRLTEVMKDFKDALEDRSKTLEHQDRRRQIYSRGQASGDNPFEKVRPTGNPDDPEGGGGMAQSFQYQSSRVSAVENVQKTIGELAQMFQKMAVMVTAQEEMIQRIDHDVDDTLHHLEKGQDDLLKYFNHISSNRWLIIKVFLILIFFVVFFVVFLA